MRLRLIVAALVVAGLGVIVPSPASAVPGLQLVTGFSALDSTASKEALAPCPTGTRVLGGGGYILGGARSVHFSRLQALGSSDQFAAGAVERGTYTGTWRVYAYAICGAAPAGLEYVSYLTGSNSDGYKTATAACTGNKQLVSMGGRIMDGGGQVILDDVMLSATLRTTTATAFEDENGYAGNWRLYSYAVCANTLPGLEFRSATSAINSGDKVVSVACPTGKRLHGLGSMMSAPSGEAIFTGLYPNAGLTTSVAISVEEGNGYNNNWWNRVYAICAF